MYKYLLKGQQLVDEKLLVKPIPSAKPRPVTILKKAVALLEAEDEAMWCQGEWRSLDEKGDKIVLSMCAVGALEAVTWGTRAVKIEDALFDQTFWAVADVVDRTPERRKAIDKATDVLDEVTKIGDIIEYNDSPARTKKQVIQKFHRAIEKLESK